MDIAIITGASAGLGQAFFRSVVRRYSKLDPHREFLLQRVTETNDITMPQLAAELLARGTKVTPASISHWYRRQGYRFKKNAAGQRSFDKLRMSGPDERRCCSIMSPPP